MIKYLPLDVMVSFLFKVEGPEDYYEVWMFWLEELLEVARSDCVTPKAPHIQFGTSLLKLDFNTEYLESCNWDFEEVFDCHDGRIRLQTGEIPRQAPLFHCPLNNVRKRVRIPSKQRTLRGGTGRGTVIAVGSMTP